MKKLQSLGTWLVVAVIAIVIGQAACGSTPDDEYDDARQGEETDKGVSSCPPMTLNGSCGAGRVWCDVSLSNTLCVCHTTPCPPPVP